MTAWRPLVEVLSAVDHPESEAHPVAAAPADQAAPASEVRAQTPQDVVFEERGIEAPKGGISTAAEVEALRRNAYQEGMALARQEAEALALRYRGAIEDLVGAKEALMRSCEADLVRLALTIAREVLMADVTGREHFTQRMVEHALSVMGDAQNMTLKMGPQDLALMRQHKPELLRRVGLNWVEDPALQLGGIVVEGDRGRMDASITQRIEAMAHKLLADQGAAS
jgi:flagellar assembly protein FliH